MSELISLRGILIIRLFRIFRLPSAQRRLVNLSLKYPLVVAPSHYFHMDHERGEFMVAKSLLLLLQAKHQTIHIRFLMAIFSSWCTTVCYRVTSGTVV